MPLADRHAAQASSVQGDPFQVTAGSSRQGSAGGWSPLAASALSPFSDSRWSRQHQLLWGPYKSIRCLGPFGTICCLGGWASELHGAGRSFHTKKSALQPWRYLFRRKS